ncbi:hypothetical protein JMUB7515_28060 [Staphylococcus aureus]
MQRSLVGSEMCIRDRLNGDAKLTEAKAAAIFSSRRRHTRFFQAEDGIRDAA